MLSIGQAHAQVDTMTKAHVRSDVFAGGNGNISADTGPAHVSIEVSARREHSHPLMNIHVVAAHETAMRPDLLRWMAEAGNRVSYGNLRIFRDPTNPDMDRVVVARRMLVEGTIQLAFDEAIPFTLQGGRRVARDVVARFGSTTPHPDDDEI